MDIYNIFLVLIWIPIVILSKKRLLKFFKLDTNTEEGDTSETSKLLKDIEKEYSDIQMAFDTEILSIKDEMYKVKHSTKPVKSDIITEGDDNKIFDFDINMYEIFNKSFSILKQLLKDFVEKIKSYIFPSIKN